MKELQKLLTLIQSCIEKDSFIEARFKNFQNMPQKNWTYNKWAS